jgi:hypothetical protein
MKCTRLLVGRATLAGLVALGLILSIGAGSAFASAPGPPTAVSATATDGQASVSFTAPANDGGTAITGYTVTAAPGGAHASGAVSPITVTGLTNGTAYTFTVTATNGATSVASSPSASVTPLAAPTASVDPKITGTAEVGDMLTASTGTWSESPVTFTYQWSDCDAETGCAPISDATDSTYTIDPYDGGENLEVSVTATNADGETTTATATTAAAVTAQANAPVVQSGPTIGTVDGGALVIANHGTWNGALPITYTYAWLSCAPDFSVCYAVGSNAQTYSPVASDSGNVLVVEVYATNVNGDSVAAVSEASAAVVFPPPTVTITYPSDGFTYYFDPLNPGPLFILGDFYSCSAPMGTTITSCTGTAPDFVNLSEPAGTYAFTVTATDSANGSATETVHYSIATRPVPQLTAPSPSTPAAPTTPEPTIEATIAVTGLAQSRSTWRLGSALPSVASVKRPPVGTAFSFNSNMAAQVTFAFSRPESGRRHGGHCVAQTAANAHQHPCTRNVGAGSFTVAAATGENTVSFDGRVSAVRKLAPGSYAVSVTATGSGSAASVGTLHFTIVG